MKYFAIAVLTALVAVFLWANPARAERPRPPLVFSRFAPEIAAEFGEKNPEKVLIVVVTPAPGNMAYIVVVMNNGHRFKWARGSYQTAIKRISNVIGKTGRKERLSGKLRL